MNPFVYPSNNEHNYRAHCGELRHSVEQEPFCLIFCDLIKSNRLQRCRVQVIRDMNSHIDVMREKEMSFSGKKRLIPYHDFNLIMSQMKNIITDLLKKISNPSTLKHIAKQAVHLYENFLLISELPTHLEIEVSEICHETMRKEEQVLKLINDELENLNQLYNIAFSCNVKSCTLL